MKQNVLIVNIIQIIVACYRVTYFGGSGGKSWQRDINHMKKGFSIKIDQRREISDEAANK